MKKILVLLLLMPFALLGQSSEMESINERRVELEKQIVIDSLSALNTLDSSRRVSYEAKVALAKIDLAELERDPCA